MKCFFTAGDCPWDSKTPLFPGEEAEGRRGQQGEEIGRRLHRAPGAHQEIVDGVVDDRRAQKPQDTGRPEGRSSHTGPRAPP